MICGYSKTKITPTVSIPIAGSYEIKYSQGVLDDLYARAISFSDGKVSAIIVYCDLCYMPTDLITDIRKCISKKTKVDYHSIMIGSTHTHAGPLTLISDNVKNDNPEVAKIIENYDLFLKEKIVEAASDAYENMKPATISCANDTVEGVSNIRRYRMKDGSVVTNPGAHNPEIDHALGAPNKTVTLLKVMREGAKDICVVNFGMHATTVGARTYLSADYPGVICSTIEKALDTECMFIPSAEGDVVQINAFPTPEISDLLSKDKEELCINKRMARYVGYKIAGTVMGMYSTAKKLSSDLLQVERRTLSVPQNTGDGDLDEAKRIVDLHIQNRHFELPYKKGMPLTTVVANAYRIVEMQDWPDYVDYDYYTVAVGEFAFVCVVGEPFTEIRNRIDEASPFEGTMVSIITNYASQYFPTTKAFSEGGYEVATTRIGRGADDLIVSSVTEMLNKQHNNLKN